MSGDLAIRPNAVGQLDLAFAGPQLLTDEGLTTAIIISWFSDRLADEASPWLAQGMDRRGWWCDAYAPIPGDKIGSGLWQLMRQKQIEPVRVEAEEMAREAVQWMIEDKIATQIEVTATFPARHWLALSGVFHRPNRPALSHHFELSWEGTVHAV
ncbi:phage GP46 family protein [Magnetococcus sp. PR-3]|uniref:phage GP46 family protein n=1 Tax=Magnetococcus sp. PR-3 TaxID=3120355 RepID=UPI002FCE08E9